LREVVAVLDHRLDLPGFDQVAERVEIVRVRLGDEENPRPPVERGGERRPRDVTRGAEQALLARATDEDDRSVGGEHGAHRSPRPVARVVEEDVVALAAASEVVARVVEDAGSAEFPGLLDVARAADGVYLRAERIR